MKPTATALSKASRRPLLSKKGNKDYYKGTRQAALAGHRTGAPGKHWVGGGGYRLLDTNVRVYVAPPVTVLNSTKLRPYVARTVKLTRAQAKIRIDDWPGSGEMTAERLLSRSKAFYSAQVVSHLESQQEAQLDAEEAEISESWGEEFVPKKEPPTQEEKAEEQEETPKSVVGRVLSKVWKR